MTPSAIARLRRRAGSWTLRRRVGTFFWACAAVLAMLVTASVLSLIEFVHNGHAVIYRWAPAASSSRSLLADMVNQETGVRGYALAGSPALLDPFDRYSTEQHADQTTLAGLLEGERRLGAYLRDFEAVAGQWRSEVAIPLISLVNAHDPSARTAVDSADAKQRFDAVRTAAARLSRAVDAEQRGATDARRQALVALIALPIGVGRVRRCSRPGGLARPAPVGAGTGRPARATDPRGRRRAQPAGDPAERPARAAGPRPGRRDDAPANRRGAATVRRKPVMSWRARTPTSSSSPTSPRTTCPSRCGRWRTSASCSNASTASSSTIAPASTSRTRSTAPSACRR